MTEVNVKELKINPNMVRNKKYPRWNTTHFLVLRTFDYGPIPRVIRIFLARTVPNKIQNLCQDYGEVRGGRDQDQRIRYPITLSPHIHQCSSTGLSKTVGLPVIRVRKIPLGIIWKE
jgi:hypothetical protein